MKIVDDIEAVCIQAHVDSKHAKTLTSLLYHVIAEGFDGIEDKDNAGMEQVVALQKCLQCIESSATEESVDCEEWADDVDPALFGRLKHRVDVLTAVKDGDNAKILLIEGKLGCAVNDAGKNTQPQHSELKAKYDDTLERLGKVKCAIPIESELYLLVSGLYKSQIARRLFIWRQQKLIPNVRCLCVHELMEIFGLPDAHTTVAGACPRLNGSSLCV